MSEDRITISLGLPEIRVLSYEQTAQEHRIRAEKVRCVVFCPKCGTSHVEAPGEERWRTIQDLPISGRPVWIELRQRRFVCQRGHRFWERFDTMALKQRQTARFQQWLLRQWSGSSIAEAVRRTGVGYRVLEWLLLKLGRSRSKATRPWPKVVGIDEYASRKGRHYDTVVVDLKGPTIFEVSEGKKAESLSGLWDRHPGKKRIRGAVIDMSAGFLAGLKALGHRVTIAVDRFHVEKHVLEAVEEVRRRIQRSVPASERRRLKELGALLRIPQQQLSPEELALCNEYLQDYPEVARALSLAKQLNGWYAHCQSVEEARKELLRWFSHVESSGIEEMIRATKALKEWIEYILNYFVLFLTNGPTEGLNTKIKLIIRLAFGLPSFERRRARLLFQCGGIPSS